MLPLLRQLQAQSASTLIAYLLQSWGRGEVASSDQVRLVAELPEPARKLSVTQKEWRVLCAIANGLSNEQIAAAMFVAHSTVKSHIRRIYRKLQVENQNRPSGEPASRRTPPPSVEPLFLSLIRIFGRLVRTMPKSAPVPLPLFKGEIERGALKSILALYGTEPLLTTSCAQSIPIDKKSQ